LALLAGAAIEDEPEDAAGALAGAGVEAGFAAGAGLAAGAAIEPPEDADPEGAVAESAFLAFLEALLVPAELSAFAVVAVLALVPAAVPEAGAAMASAFLLFFEDFVLDDLPEDLSDAAADLSEAAVASVFLDFFDFLVVVVVGL
jgi:hypothetical protein